MRYAIIGSRTFLDYEKFKKSIDPHLPYITQIISGGAVGADSLASDYANEHDIPLLVFKPDWINNGIGAGFIRNKSIVQSSDIVLAFWDMKSNGTKHSLIYAKKLKIKTIVINIETKIRQIEKGIDLWQI